MIRRAFRYRLYPTAEQEKQLWQTVGATRFVFNLALEQRRDWWRQYRAATGGSLNFASQGRQVTQLRREVDWLAAVAVAPLHQALRDLDRAFSAFFSGRARYPNFRSRGSHDRFRFQGTDTRFFKDSARWSSLQVPRVGRVKFRDTRPILGHIESVTVSHDALGWHICVATVRDHDAPANDNPAVGIDRGIAIALVLSSGERIAMPDLTRLERQRHRAQRTLCRRKRGSYRREKQRRRVSRIAAKIGRIRNHWQHVASTDIARRFGRVVLEDLNTAGMTAKGRGKHGLNRSILAQGWYAFAAKVAYKLEERGGSLELVNPAYSSQTCSDCGTVDSRSRESQASFVCVECGFRANADHNAAIIILRRSTASMPVEGRGCAPVEAGTCLEAA